MSDSATPWTITPQAPLSMGFSWQEYWSGKPFPSPGDLPNPGIEPRLPHCRQIFYHLSHKGSPRILEWVAYPFSRRSSQHRDQTRSPTLQEDPLPAKLPGKPLSILKINNWIEIIFMRHKNAHKHILTATTSKHSIRKMFLDFKMMLCLSS